MKNLLKVTSDKTHTAVLTNRFGRKRNGLLWSIQGRLEFDKDGLAVLQAASHYPLHQLVFDGHTVTLTWEVGLDGELWPELVEQAEQAANGMVQELIDELGKGQTMFNDWNLAIKGIEPHVFVESLKPASDYDGHRDGPYCDWDGSHSQYEKELLVALQA